MDNTDLAIGVGCVGRSNRAARGSHGYGLGISSLVGAGNESIIPSAGFSAAAAPLQQVPSTTRDLVVRLVDPGDASPGLSSFEDEAADARRVTLQFRRAHVAAALVYSIIANTAFFLAQWTTTMPLDVGITIAFLLLAPEIFITIWFFSLA